MRVAETPATKWYGEITIDFTRPMEVTSFHCRLHETGSLEIEVVDANGGRVGLVALAFFRPGEVDSPSPWDRSWRPGRVLPMPCVTYLTEEDAWPMRLDGVPPGDYEVWVIRSFSRGSRATTNGSDVITVRERQTVRLDEVRLAD
jgi:hypothetical protein